MPDCIRSTNIVLLPGMMCSDFMWRQQLHVFGAGWQVQHGTMDRDESIEAIAQRVLDESPQRFALAGLSMGGIVAMAMWRLAPQRIERLALLDTNFRADTDERRAIRYRQIEQVRAGALERVLRDELKPNYLAECHRGNSALLGAVLEMGMEMGADAFVRQSLALRDRLDSTATLTTIDCPTLVLCGEEDRLCTPQLHRDMAAEIPLATLEIIPDCGHLSTMEQPERVSEKLYHWLQAN